MFIPFFRDDDTNFILFLGMMIPYLYHFLGMMIPFLYHVYTIVSDDDTIFIPCLYHFAMMMPFLYHLYTIFSG